MSLEQIDRRIFVKGAAALATIGLIGHVLGQPTPAEASPYIEPPRASDSQPPNPRTLIIKNLLYHQVTYGRLLNDWFSFWEMGYQPISLETQIRALRGEQKIPEGLKTFMVTMDDGRKSQYETSLKAVELFQAKTGWFVPITFFIMTKFGDPKVPLEEVPPDTPTYSNGVYAYMNMGEVEDLIRRDHQIQNHTVDHPNLREIKPLDAGDQIKRGEERIDILWKKAGRTRKYRVMAYPYGAYNELILKILSDEKFDAAFTINPTDIQSSETPLELGRIRLT